VPTWMALRHRGSGAAVDADTLVIRDEAVASRVPPDTAAARPFRSSSDSHPGPLLPKESESPAFRAKRGMRPPVGETCPDAEAGPVVRAIACVRKRSPGPGDRHDRGAAKAVAAERPLGGISAIIRNVFHFRGDGTQLTLASMPE